MTSRAQRFDDWLERMSDRINPMLLREVRQAMRSRVIVGTFGVFLLAAWGMSLVGVARNQEMLEFIDIGGSMFVLLVMVLGVCLLLPVPLQVFLSIRREFDDSTFEMLVVTTLTPQRIVTGKLQAGGVQALLYCSAIVPFLSFCYLLGGIGILEMLGSFVGLAFLTFGMCLWGLLLGAISSNLFWQGVNLCLLLLAGWGGITLFFQWVFWISEVGVEGMVCSAVCGSVLLMFLFAIAFGISTSRLDPVRSVRGYHYGSISTDFERIQRLKPLNQPPAALPEKAETD